LHAVGWALLEGVQVARSAVHGAASPQCQVLRVLWRCPHAQPTRQQAYSVHVERGALSLRRSPPCKVACEA